MTAASRIPYLKRIRDPNDEDNYLDIPLTRGIAFIDSKAGGQGIVLAIDNGPESGRMSFVVSVENPADADQYVNVERVFAIFTRDAKSGAEVRCFLLGNKSGIDESPPCPPTWQEGDNAHAAVHYVRYCEGNDPAADKWIEVEAIDVLILRDAKDSAQVHAIILDWGEPGEEIIDDDDPYTDMPGGVTLGFIDSTLEVMDEFDRECPDGKFIDPVNEEGGWRLDWFQNIVNVNWGGVIELEVNIADAPQTMASVYQNGTAVDDCTKFLFSGFFNFPSLDESESAPAWVEPFEGYWLLFEFGGAEPIVDPGQPITSRITVEYAWPDGPEPTYWIKCNFVGGLVEIPWDIGHPTFYPGVLSNSVDFIAGATNNNANAPIDATINAGRSFGASLKIGGPTKWAQFLDKWHELLITFDIGAASDWDDEPTEVYYAWLTESAAQITESGGIPAFNAPLETKLYDVGLAPDPTNIIFVSPVYDIRGYLNPPHQPGTWNWSLLPNANDLPNHRIYVKAQESPPGGGQLWGYIDPDDGYVGTALVSWPFTRFKSGAMTAPLKMLLDDVTKLDPVETGSGSVSLGSFSWVRWDNAAPDDREGIVVKGKQIAVTGKEKVKALTEGLFTNRVAVPTRLHLYQVWFDETKDIYDPLVRERFLTVATDPDDGKRYGKPAVFTQQDKDYIAALALPPGSPLTPLSPAWVSYGRPHLYMKGGPGTEPLGGPSFPRAGGFSHNRGRAGDFLVSQEVESFSPGPSKIIIP